MDFGGFEHLGCGVILVSCLVMSLYCEKPKI